MAIHNLKNAQIYCRDLPRPMWGARLGQLSDQTLRMVSTELQNPFLQRYVKILLQHRHGVVRA